MNREEAAYIIEVGKDAIKKLGSISGRKGEILTKWVKNWEFIEAFANGKMIGVNADGNPFDSPDFDCNREFYEILEHKINWRKVVENGGLHVRLVACNVPCRLVGVNKTGTPIAQAEDGLCIFLVGNAVFFHDEVVTRPEWYEQA